MSIPSRRESIRPAEEAERTLYVGNLDDRVTEDLLYELMIQAGPVEKVSGIRTDKRYAFVVFEDEESVLYSIDLFRNVKLFGRQLSLKPRQNTENERKLQLSNSRAQTTLIKPPSPRPIPVRALTALPLNVSPTFIHAQSAWPNPSIAQHGGWPQLPPRPFMIPAPGSFAFAPYANNYPPIVQAGPWSPVGTSLLADHQIGFPPLLNAGAFRQRALLPSSGYPPYPTVTSPSVPGMPHDYAVIGYRTPKASSAGIGHGSSNGHFSSGRRSALQDHSTASRCSSNWRPMKRK